LKKSQEEDRLTIEEVAKAQLSVSQQIEQNTKSAISGIRMGKATTEPLEKMFTTVMGAQVDLSRNIANSVSPKGTRQTLTAIGQPMEDYIVGGVTDNQQMQKDATKDFLAALDVTEQKIKAGSQEFLTTTLTDISNRFKDAYSQPQKIETKSDVNFNMTINGNDNVKNMDLNAIKGDIVNYLTQTAEGKDLLKKAIENPNAPTAMTGGKN
jgi:hypothetical protein